jgi:hypothetical protein
VAAWHTRQHEIDVLKAEISTADSVSRVVIAEMKRLKAENERLREDSRRFGFLVSCFVRCDLDMSGSHHWFTRGRSIGRGQTALEAIDAAIKDFSTTQKESEMSGIPSEWERKCKFAELMGKYPGNVGMAAGAYQAWLAKRWAERISIWQRMKTK